MDGRGVIWFLVVGLIAGTLGTLHYKYYFWTPRTEDHTEEPRPTDVL